MRTPDNLIHYNFRLLNEKSTFGPIDKCRFFTNTNNSVLDYSVIKTIVILFVAIFHVTYPRDGFSRQIGVNCRFSETT